MAEGTPSLASESRRKPLWRAAFLCKLGTAKERRSPAGRRARCSAGSSVRMIGSTLAAAQGCSAG